MDGNKREGSRQDDGNLGCWHSGVIGAGMRRTQLRSDGRHELTSVCVREVEDLNK